MDGGVGAYYKTIVTCTFGILELLGKSRVLYVHCKFRVVMSTLPKSFVVKANPNE
jgi:hypothetical protein